MTKAFFTVLCFATVFTSQCSYAQKVPEGIWQGYEGELKHVTSQLIALAEATPEEKFSWRPAPGVRSTSEVYMHIALANFWLLTFTGRKATENLDLNLEKKVTKKKDVIDWLKHSLQAVQEAHGRVTPKEMEREVHIVDRDATVDGIFLRIIIHNNEHMGQLIAYARMSGVVPPWSKE